MFLLIDFFLLSENISFVHLWLTENNFMSSKSFGVMGIPSMAIFAVNSSCADFVYIVYGKPHPSTYCHPSNCAVGQISNRTSGPLDDSIVCDT